MNNPHPNSLRPWLLELFDKHFPPEKIGIRYGWRDETDLSNGMKLDDAPEQECFMIRLLRHPDADIYRENSWITLAEIFLTYDAHGVPVSLRFHQDHMQDSLECCRALLGFRAEVGQAIGINSDSFSFDYEFTQHQLVDLIERNILRQPPIYESCPGAR